MTLADRLVVIRDGEVVQVDGAPEELHHEPGDRFVAGAGSRFNPAP